MNQLTHLDQHGNANMVDITKKSTTDRIARAQAIVTMQPSTMALLIEGNHKKGDVLTVAKIAGIQAAKQCSNLIPLCHPLALSSIDIDLEVDEANNTVHIVTSCKVSGQTGVEMEALTAASVTALTIYDMCKAVDKTMVIGNIKLLHKSGGKTGTYNAN